jgi:hypothetical protein
MKKAALWFALLSTVFLAAWARESSFADRQQNFPRKPLVFKFQATLQGIKGEYAREADVSENSSFYIRDWAGAYRWTMAVHLGAVKNKEIPVHFWLTWALPVLKEESVESSFTLRIGDKPKLVPENVASLVAYASIVETGAGPEEPTLTALDRHHPAWLVLQSYLISLKTNDYKLFQACFAPKSGTGLANIGRSSLANYRKAFLQKYRNLNIDEIKIVILNQDENRVDYSVLTGSGEVIDVPHLKKGTFLNIRATTWKIDW